MRGLREIESSIKVLESKKAGNAMRITTIDGERLLLPFRGQDGALKLLCAAIENRDHPYKKYILNTREAHPDDGMLALTAKAVWDSYTRIAAEKAGLV